MTVARRRGSIERSTRETSIRVELDVDGDGSSVIETPIGFLSHMLEQVARHAALRLRIHATGDVHVDGHHITEDVGHALGLAVAQACGDKQGIRRYGWALVPMDEARVRCALDLSGRPFFVWRVDLPKAQIGEFPTELTEVFFEAFARGAACNLHVVLEEGHNLHHIVEACFKAFAHALRSALERDARRRDVPSTKGTLCG